MLFKLLVPFKIIEGARLISLQDIIPMKLQALSNRFDKKDFWDIVFLLNSFTLAQMLEIFKSKFPTIDVGFIIHSLTNFDDANVEPSPVQLLPKTWEEIKLELQHVVIDYTQSLL